MINESLSCNIFRTDQRKAKNASAVFIGQFTTRVAVELLAKHGTKKTTSSGAAWRSFYHTLLVTYHEKN